MSTIESALKEMGRRIEQAKWEQKHPPGSGPESGEPPRLYTWSKRAVQRTVRKLSPGGLQSKRRSMDHLRQQGKAKEWRSPQESEVILREILHMPEGETQRALVARLKRDHGISIAQSSISKMRRKAYRYLHRLNPARPTAQEFEDAKAVTVGTPNADHTGPRYQLANRYAGIESDQEPTTVQDDSKPMSVLEWYAHHKPARPHTMPLIRTSKPQAATMQATVTVLACGLIG